MTFDTSMVSPAAVVNASRVYYTDELQPVTVVIPVYLPITLRVATGFRSRDTTAFNLWTRALTRLTHSFFDESFRLCQGRIQRCIRPLLSNVGLDDYSLEPPSFSYCTSSKHTTV